MAHARVLEREQSVLVVIDVQEAYRNLAFEHDRMLRNVRRLIEAAKAVDVPILATEQYPKGLGHFMPEVSDCFPSATQIIEKRSLSCCGQPEFAAALEAMNRRQVVVCGLEAHACVNQTAHDLLARNYQVHLPYDAISSRFEIDYRVGLEKIVGSGAVPATVEMICLEWVRTADSPQFRVVQKLIK